MSGLDQVRALDERERYLLAQLDFERAGRLIVRTVVELHQPWGMYPHEPSICTTDADACEELIARGLIEEFDHRALKVETRRSYRLSAAGEEMLRQLRFAPAPAPSERER